MSGEIKTIKMPKATWDKWEAALTSGEYKQTTDALCDNDGGYCCLGVLQHCLTGEVEHFTFGGPKDVPSKRWLLQHGITFHGMNTDSQAPSVLVNGRMECVTNLNDKEVPFAKIVEFMRPHVETY